MSGEELRAAERATGTATETATNSYPSPNPNPDPDPIASADAAHDDGPEHIPGRVWVTLVGFAVFVVAFGTCAVNYLFK